MQLLEIRDGRDAAVEAIQTRLEFLRDARQHAVLQHFHRLRLTRGSILGNRHAVRVVHDDGDDVLLRLQFRHRDGGLPEEKEHDGGER